MGRTTRSKGKDSPTAKMSDSRNNKSLIDEKSLQLILSALTSNSTEKGEEENSQGVAGEKGGGKVLSEIDTSDVGSIFKHLLSALAILTKKVQMLEENTNKSSTDDPGNQFESQLRTQVDYTDEIKQRSLKGNLILTSTSKGNRRSVLRSEKDLSENKILLVDHVTDLIQQKYSVSLPKDDIQACHRLPNGSVILRIWRRTEDSAWTRLVDSIKKGQNPDFNFYANFHLTKRRSDLAYELRKFRQSGKIVKYFTDENGSLSFKLKENSKKCKITFFREKDSSNGKTFLKSELVDLINLGE